MKLKAQDWIKRDTQNRAKIIAYLDILQSIESGELYKWNIHELMRRCPNEQLPPGGVFKVENRDADMQAIALKLQELLS